MNNPHSATRIICLSVIILSHLGSFAQNSRFSVFSDSTISTYQVVEDIPSLHIDEKYQNGIVIASGINNGIASHSDIIVRCMDRCDNLLWSATYAMPAVGLHFADLDVTTDGHIIIAGHFQQPLNDIFIMKLTMEGEVVFFKSYVTVPGEYAYSIVESADGDYMVRGNTMINMSVVSRNFILRTHPNGEINWSKMYFSIPIWGRSIATSDNGLISRTGNVIYKLDANGTLQWAKSLNAGGFYYTPPVEVDDGYVFGRYRSWGFSDPIAFAFKLNKQGDLSWVGETFKASSLQRPVQLANGNIVFPGVVQIDTINEVSTHAFLTEINSEGEIQNQAAVSLQGNNATFQPYLAKSENTMRLIGLTGEEGAIENLYTFVQRLNSPDWINSCQLHNVDLTLTPTVLTIQDFDFESGDLNMSVLDHEVDLEYVTESMDMVCEMKEPLEVVISGDSVFCSNDSMELSIAGNYDQITWSTGEHGNSIFVDTSGTYWVNVEHQCNTAADSIKVNVYQPVTPKYIVSPLKTTPLEEVVFSSKNDEPGTVFWIIDGDTVYDEHMTAYFNENGNHPVCYGFRDTNGCIVKRQFNIQVDYFLYFVPNTFSPNGDGKNDLFFPSGFGIDYYEMEIFNQWGDRIFNKSNTPWDGRVAGNLVSNEVFVYKIFIRSYQGEQTKFSGRILVLQ